jgi:hypothetical protein
VPAPARVSNILPQAPPPQPISNAELREILAGHAAKLRAELLVCIEGAVKPILAESEALRSWHARAAAFIDKASPLLCSGLAAAGPGEFVGHACKGFVEDCLDGGDPVIREDPGILPPSGDTEMAFEDGPLVSE